MPRPRSSGAVLSIPSSTTNPPQPTCFHAGSTFPSLTSGSERQPDDALAPLAARFSSAQPQRTAQAHAINTSNWIPRGLRIGCLLAVQTELAPPLNILTEGTEGCRNSPRILTSRCPPCLRGES